MLDADGLLRAVAAGRQRNTLVPFRRVELRYVELRSGLHLQVSSYDDRQAHIRNVGLGAEAEREVDTLLAGGYANWHLETAAGPVDIRVTKKGRWLLHRGPGREPGDAPDRPEGWGTRPRDRTHDRAHDRVKRRRLDESDPLFRELGITTDDGVVKPTRTAKFRQVQDLLAAVDPLIDKAVDARADGVTSERPLQVVDLGCGNAYLTFGLVRYLEAVKGLPARVVGVDIKPAARAHNSEVAERLGLGDVVDFVEGSINDAQVPVAPDMVVALHACDTATDDALARAVRWQAPVVVAAPCCHHDIARQLRGVEPPDGYRLLTRHGILRERFADVLTDALRAAILRLVGYRCDVVEFVDSRHTPRNALIRAVRTGAAPRPADVEAYRLLVDAWHVHPALAALLAPDLAALPVDRPGLQC